MASNPDTGRYRTHRLYPDLGPCEECRAVPAVERHHVDGDTFNTAPENVQRLCRRCHEVVDGRLAALLAQQSYALTVRSLRQRARTKCKRGHEYTPENTYVYADGRRGCRACAALRMRTYRARDRI